MKTAPAVHPKDNPAESLRQQLFDGLRTGRWVAGTRLPTEREFCVDFGVSRSALRRVLQDLRDRGLIIQKVGSGTYVADKVPVTPADEPLAQGTFLAVSSVSPAEIMEARFLLEPNLVDLIVNNATVKDFEQLEACCKRSEEAESLEEFERWDSALHEQMAQASHNALFVSIFKLIADIRNSGEWGVLKKRVLTPQRRVVLQQEHRRIVRALKSRDSLTARRELLEHLAQARANLLWRS